MKRLICIVLTLLIFVSVTIAQTYKEIIGKCRVEAVSDFEEYKSFYIYLPDNTKKEITIEKMASLLRKDVITYFDLDTKYNSDLKKSVFKKTSEYSELYQRLMGDYNIVKGSNCFLLYNLRYNNKYDVSKHNFSFKLGIDELYRYSPMPNNICFKGGISLSYPTKYVTRKQERNSLTTTGIYNTITLSTPSISEQTAIKIEDEIDSPYCNANLLFVFKLTQSAIEKKTVSGCIIPQEYIIGKTVGAYLVNVKSEEIYADFSNIFFAEKSVTRQTNRKK